MKYQQLESAFRRLLSDDDDSAYTQVVHALTSDFAQLSHEVNAVEGLLAQAQEHSWASHIRLLQQHEQEKLHMTCTLHVLRREHARYAWSWQQPIDAVSTAGSPAGHARTHGLERIAQQFNELQERQRNDDTDVQQGSRTLESTARSNAIANGATIEQDANGMYEPSVHQASARGCADVAEPTQTEYYNAVAEATQRLEEAVASINELMDEVQEAICDES